MLIVISHQNLNPNFQLTFTSSLGTGLCPQFHIFMSMSIFGPLSILFFSNSIKSHWLLLVFFIFYESSISHSLYILLCFYLKVDKHSLFFLSLCFHSIHLMILIPITFVLYIVLPFIHKCVIGIK